MTKKKTPKQFKVDSLVTRCQLADKVFKITMIIKIKGLVQKTEKYVDRW